MQRMVFGILVDCNYISVNIPQKFNYKLYGIKGMCSKIRFLRKMCKDSVNAPIIKNNKAVGVIQKSSIKNIKEGFIISYGLLFSKGNHELFKDGNKTYRFSAIKIDER